MKRSQVQVLVAPPFLPNQYPFGALAQLVERLLCKQDVRSSNLLGSTDRRSAAPQGVALLPVIRLSDSGVGSLLRILGEYVPIVVRGHDGGRIALAVLGTRLS